MKTPLSVINELAQKRLIDTPIFDIEIIGVEHAKEFKCTISINNFEPVVQVASSKEKSKRKAAEILLSHIKEKVDITAKAVVKGDSKAAATSIKANNLGVSNNPVSQLLEFEQAGFIDSVTYHFNEFDIKPQRQYECICELGKLQTKAICTSKKKAKAQAARLLVEQIIVSEDFEDREKQIEKEKHAPKTAPIKPVSKELNINSKTPAALVLELQQQGLIKSLSFHFNLVDGVIICCCYADNEQIKGSAKSKKEAKQLAAQRMLDLLKSKDIKPTDSVKNSNQFLVEQNACAEWIRSICPSDIDLKNTSWYLASDCVLLNLGLKKQNPHEKMQAFKSQIEKETKLLVLINRDRDAKQAIENLKSIADSDGFIKDGKVINKVAQGSYYRPKQYAEPQINWANRKDHTKDHCFTIDSDSSIDLDDAFSVETTSDNKMIVHIHIADVSELVIENSKEDNKAITQCFTYYGASKQLPMLYGHTMFQASLLPHKDRMAWTVKMVLTEDAKLETYSIYPSVIRSKFRLDQKAITQLIDSNANQQSKDFQAMVKMSDKLLSQRLDKGGVNDLAEEIAGYQLVQEFMLLANRCVADFCIQKNIAIPYRVHKFADDSLDIQAMYNETKNHKALLPFLGKASYSAIPSEHEALAFKGYCHFTSPIRRYADLVVQRQLRRFHFGEPLQPQEELEAKIEKINQCEQALDMSQTTIRYIERLQVQFLQVGKKMETVIDEISDNYYILKSLSHKCDFKLRLSCDNIADKLSVGNALFVKQLSSYDVINEVFDCVVLDK